MKILKLKENVKKRQKQKEMRQRLTTKHDAHCENAQKKLKL